MNRYRDGLIRKIAKGVNIAYLTTAILWGGATICFSAQRYGLKEDYKNNEISRQEYLEKSKEFTNYEGAVFGALTATLLTTFIVDIASPESERDR